MGDRVTFLAFAGPTRDNARVVLDDVARRMRAEGWIAGDEDPDAILGAADGPVFRPGPAVADRGGDTHLAELRTNGAEFIAGRVVNYGPMIASETLTCPHCGVSPCDPEAPDHDPGVATAFFDGLGQAALAGDFGPDAVTCPACEVASGVNFWADSFVIAGAAVTLWNWQSSPAVIDPILALMRDAAPGQRVVTAGYKI